VRLGDHVISFTAGETIHTENSHKYSVEGLSQMVAQAGWQVAEMLTDPDTQFAVTILQQA